MFSSKEPGHHNCVAEFLLNKFVRISGESHFLNIKLTTHHLLWFFIIIGFFLWYYITSFTTSRVDGSSMFPTLKNEEFLLVQKYRFFHRPNRGDIISAKLDQEYNNDSNGTTVVKRVIGLPGEIVEFKNRRFQIINPDRGYIKFQELYLPDKDLTPSWDGAEKRFLVPSGEYFVLGDNREISEDSRSYGTIPFKNIIGKVIYKIPAVYKMKEPEYKFDIKPLDQVVSEKMFEREKAELEKLLEEREAKEALRLKMEKELGSSSESGVTNESIVGATGESLDGVSAVSMNIASSTDIN